MSALIENMESRDIGREGVARQNTPIEKAMKQLAVSGLLAGLSSSFLGRFLGLVIIPIVSAASSSCFSLAPGGSPLSMALMQSSFISERRAARSSGESSLGIQDATRLEGVSHFPSSHSLKSCILRTAVPVRNPETVPRTENKSCGCAGSTSGNRS